MVGQTQREAGSTLIPNANHSHSMGFANLSSCKNLHTHVQSNFICSMAYLFSVEKERKRTSGGLSKIEPNAMHI